jgi:pimeloyl-ACP methyl ester carboxylesterase
MRRATRFAGYLLTSWVAFAAQACGDDDSLEDQKPIEDASSAVSGGKRDGGGDGDSSTASRDGATAHRNSPEPAPALECDRVVADEDCDRTLRPIVFVHGTFGSATEISNTAQLFGSNGYCQDRFVAVEYNSLGGSPQAQLEALVDRVLADTGFEQVDLAAHSQGTRHACTYLSDPARRAKVAHYLNISGACDGAGVPTLSLSSQNDTGGTPRHSSGDNVEQVTLEQEDHVALSGSKAAFSAMYEYLMGEAPAHTRVLCGQDPVVLDGKSVTFGDNEPVANGTIEAFAIDQLDSPRERGEPDVVITTDAEGHFRAELARGVRYEFRVLAADGRVLGYGYQAPFKRSNYLSRFLTSSMNPLVAAASLDRVTRSPAYSGLIGRYVAGAFRKDWGNSLVLDGVEILDDVNAPRAPSVVGLFMFDANANGLSDRGAVFSGSFLLGSDVFIDASEPRWVDLEWTNEEGNTAKLAIPNWPSSDTLISVSLPY